MEPVPNYGLSSVIHILISTIFLSLIGSLNFAGPAKFWMQTIELNLKQCSWEQLSQLVVERFDRDQFNHFIRQFFHTSIPKWLSP